MAWMRRVWIHTHIVYGLNMTSIFVLILTNTENLVNTSRLVCCQVLTSGQKNRTNTESVSQMPHSDYEATRADSCASYPCLSSESITFDSFDSFEAFNSFDSSTSRSPDCDSGRHRRWQILSGECSPWLWPKRWRWSLQLWSLSRHGLVHQDYFVWSWTVAWNRTSIYGNIMFQIVAPF